MSSVPPPPTPPEPLPTIASAPQGPVPPAEPPMTQQPPLPQQAAPPAPEPKGSSTRLGVIVGIGITLTLVVLAGALFALFSTLSKIPAASDDDGDEPSIAVEESPPCDGCLTFDDALELRMPDGVPSLGLTFDDEVGYTKPSIVGAYADSSTATYEDGGGTPVGCSFAIDYAPVSPTSPDEGNRTDRVADLGSFYGDDDYLSLVARVFTSEADAAAYPESLRAGLAACPHYSFSFTDGSDFWSTDVQQLDFATSSPAVTAVGWHESYNGSELLVVDVQYANLAVRAMYSRTGTGTEEEFRTFVLELSAALEGLK